jgi:SAM-dependent methyltransferase
MVEHVPNICAGPYGALYDFCIERPWLMRKVGRIIWGVDCSVLYDNMEPIRRAPAGATIVDVPCGGGVAFRALSPSQDVRYLAVDLSPKMLRRAGRRARARSLKQVELLEADMTDLPFADGEVDLLLSYSGLHMLPDPEKAIAEMARCLKPGGELVGTAFFSDSSRRARALFKIGSHRGHPLPPSREGLRAWLEAAGFEEPTVGLQTGFAAFGGRKSGN